MTKTIQGRHVPALRSFAGILDSWIAAITDVTRAWKPREDIPWWYNERALLSIFAGAVWLAQGIAFEEFSTEKRVPGKRTRGAQYSGRQDLLIQVGKNSFIVESKIVWSGASARHAHPNVTVGKALAQACQDARCTPSNEERKLGLVFARPYIRWKYQEEVDAYIARWLRAARQVDYSCCAWVFPAESRLFGSDMNILPGLAVFIREV